MSESPDPFTKSLVYVVQTLMIPILVDVRPDTDLAQVPIKLKDRLFV